MERPRLPVQAAMSLVFAASSLLAASAPTGDQAVQATGIDAGLCVHYGATTGTLATELAQRGTLHIDVMADGAAALTTIRQAVTSAGALGLVVSERITQTDYLPWADNLVSLFVADLDALGNRAPSGGEIDRVLSPGGAAYVLSGGSWRKRVKARPAGMDDWSHWCYGPGGNAVSHDKLVKPVTSFKWVAGVRAHDLRLSGGRAFYSSTISRNKLTRVMTSRDAYNGLLLWNGSTSSQVQYSNAPTKHSLVAWNGKVIYYPKVEPCYAVCMDGKTGQREIEYTNGIRWPDTLAKRTYGGLWIDGGKAGKPFMIVVDGTLIQSFRKRVVALDAQSGTVQWTYTAQEGIGYMVSSADGDTVFLQESSDTVSPGSSRWGELPAVAVSCVVRGTRKWRTTEIVDACSQLVYDNGVLVFFNETSNMQKDGEVTVARINPADGAVMWHNEPFTTNYNLASYSCVIRDSKVYHWGAFDNLYSNDLATGTATRELNTGYNQRCPRMSATDDWLIYGLVKWTDKNNNWVQQSVARSDCATPGYPANGQVYWGYNSVCGCINPIRGLLVLDAGAGQPATADNLRTETAAQMGKAAYSTPRAKRRASHDLASSSVIAQDWLVDSLLFFVNMSASTEAMTDPVTAGSLTLRADIHRGRLSARNGSGEVWSFTAGGRIYMAPVVYQDACLVASADGWLYCLNLADGAPRWRFMAAPSERKVIAYGQVESAWPTYRAAVYGGTVYISAGRHAELDGGIYLWGLSPASGQVTWKSRILVDNQLMPSTAKIPYTRDQYNTTPINGFFVADSTGLSYGSIRFFKPQGGSGCCGGFMEPGSLPHTSSYTADLAAWNGQAINPHTMQPVKLREQAPAPVQQVSARLAVGRGWIMTSRRGEAEVLLFSPDGRAEVVFKGIVAPGRTTFSFPRNLARGFYLVQARMKGTTTSGRVLVM